MAPAVNIELYAQDKGVSGTKVGSAIRPVVGSPYPANADVVPPYSANWKKPIFDKFFGEVTEGTARRTEDSSATGGGRLDGLHLGPKGGGRLREAGQE